MDIIGIIILTEERFHGLVNILNFKDVKYVHLNSIGKCKGCRFNQIYKSYDWRKVENHEEILKQSTIRLFQ